MPFPEAFRRLADRRIEAARQAAIERLRTVDDRSAGRNLERIGSAWTRDRFSGDFYLSPLPADAPAVSIVIVQSREGNTVAHNPADLGGGPTDTHLIYEGLSRVAADAVLAGAATAAGPDVVFSTWHPDIVALRAALGLSRHPAQIVISNDGRADIDRTLLFNVPDLRVFVLAGAVCQDRCARAFAARPWITIVPIAPGRLREALVDLRRTHGLRRISAIGGRTTASSLVAAGVVQDLYLTTTARSAGEPDTPWYVGQDRPALDLILRKDGGGEMPIRFEHFAVCERPG